MKVLLDSINKDRDAISVQPDAASYKFLLPNTQAECTRAVKLIDIFAVNFELIQDIAVKLDFVVEYTDQLAAQPFARA